MCWVVRGFWTPEIFRSEGDSFCRACTFYVFWLRTYRSLIWFIIIETNIAGKCTFSAALQGLSAFLWLSMGDTFLLPTWSRTGPPPTIEFDNSNDKCCKSLCIWKNVMHFHHSLSLFSLSPLRSIPFKYPCSGWRKNSILRKPCISSSCISRMQFEEILALLK